MSKFGMSVLRPFEYGPIKPYFDYALNTSIYEQTYEMDISMTAGNGNGILPNGTYGTSIVILPHAY